MWLVNSYHEFLFMLASWLMLSWHVAAAQKKVVALLKIRTEWLTSRKSDWLCSASGSQAVPKCAKFEDPQKGYSWLLLFPWANSWNGIHTCQHAFTTIFDDFQQSTTEIKWPVFLWMCRILGQPSFAGGFNGQNILVEKSVVFASCSWSFSGSPVALMNWKRISSPVTQRVFASKIPWVPLMWRWGTVHHGRDGLMKYLAVLQERLSFSFAGLCPTVSVHLSLSAMMRINR